MATFYNALSSIRSGTTDAMKCSSWAGYIKRITPESTDTTTMADGTTKVLYYLEFKQRDKDTFKYKVGTDYTVEYVSGTDTGTTNKGFVLDGQLMSDIFYGSDWIAGTSTGFDQAADASNTNVW